MKCWVLGLVLVAVVGCKGKESTTAPTSPANTTEVASAEVSKLTIRVTANDDGNAGRPLWVVVRTVTYKDFVEDQYQDIAALVTAPDETRLARFVVFPGRSNEAEFVAPEGSVGVYGLFTEANGTTWKRMFESSKSSKVIEVVAGRTGLLEDE